MQIIFEYHDVMQSNRLESLANEKLNKLQNKFQMVHRADVFFKIENTASVKTGKICNIRLSLPGPRLFAESSNENFESAISETINELEKQLRKTKEKTKGY